MLQVASLFFVLIARDIYNSKKHNNTSNTILCLTQDRDSIVFDL